MKSFYIYKNPSMMDEEMFLKYYICKWKFTFWHDSSSFISFILFSLFIFNYD